MSGIPHDIYEQLPDEDKGSPFASWNALKKQLEGTDKILANRKKAALLDMDNFKMLPNETLFDAYSRYNIVVNRVKKLKGERSQEDFNLKFLNIISPKCDHISKIIKEYVVNVEYRVNYYKDELIATQFRIEELKCRMAKLERDHEIKIKAYLTSLVQYELMLEQCDISHG